MNVKMSGLIIRLFIISSVYLVSCEEISHNEIRRIPKSLMLGAASSAYQVEGAWDSDGKAENIYDYLTHTQPCYALDCSNGDVTSNSYYMYKTDIAMLRALGVDFYRFSLSWTRILPTSFPDKINKAGVQHYNNLIDELLEHNIIPVVTIFHWDLPQKLQELGGWANPKIVDWYGDYARVIFQLFGDRVKYWITINEPHQICQFGYGGTILAPALNLTGEADYLCAKNLLLAHARGYHIYDEDFRPSQGGTIFITINAEWFEPISDNEIEAANDANEFWWGAYSHPIFSLSGDFPQAMKERIGLMSALQGFTRSRLPEMSNEEIQYVRGSSDIFGLNHYSTLYTYRNISSFEYNSYIQGPSYDADRGISTVEIYQPPEWKIGETNTAKIIPFGFYKILSYIRNEYNNIPVFVTENGFANRGDSLVDDDRITYHREYISAMLDAIDDGSNVIGYTVWSLMDSYEWNYGYQQRYGLFHIDFEDPARIRIPRKSAYVYKELIRTRALDMHYEPDISNTLSID